MVFLTQTDIRLYCFTICMNSGHILIAGGSGLVGTSLSLFLQSKGYQVALLSRRGSSGTKIKTFRWDPATGFLDPEALQGCTAVVNLAGAGVADKSWSKAYKKELLDSRVQSTATLVQSLQKEEYSHIHLINASAIGFYENGDDLKREDDPAGNEFLSFVCKTWETEAKKLEEHRLSIVRIGIVLSPNGGFVAKMAQPIRFGLGAALGSGKQLISWIHVHDLAAMITFLLENKKSGIYNAVAPNPSSNRDMTAAIARILHKPFFLPPVPKFMLQWIMGEFTSELLANHRISCDKISGEGFRFEFPELLPALEDCLK